MVTWGLATEFGGMTTMCLTRARTLYELAGVVAPVLTFDFRSDYEETISALRARGHVVDGMEVRNVYDHYRSANLTSREPIHEELALQPVRAEIDIQKQTILDAGGNVFCLITRSLDAQIEYRREYRRPEGSTFLLDEATMDDDGQLGERLLSLLDEHGNCVGQYRGHREFFRGWLVELAGHASSVFIGDSVQTIDILAGLTADNAIKLMVLHNSHIAGGGDPVRGKLTPSRRNLVKESQLWDGLLFLTERHRQDFVDRFGEANNLFCLSNPAPREQQFPPFNRRRRTRGVMVCRLEAVKNVEAAIDVIDAVRRTVPDVRLDVYGDGKQRHGLQQRIDDLRLGRNIKLHGHIAKASTQFETARFALLTSKKEGQPLVLLESLGFGCPPVAFDIRYGPEDIIDDAVNGFVVPDGDILGAANRIVSLCTDDSLAESMSLRAWEDSERYGHHGVLGSLGKIIDQIWEQKPQRFTLESVDFQAERLALTESGHIELIGRFTWDQTSGEPAEDLLLAHLQVVPRRNGRARALPGETVSKSQGELAVRFLVSSDEFETGLASDTLLDIFVLLSGRNMLSRHRVKFIACEGQWGRAAPYATANHNLSFKAAVRS